MTRPYAGVFPVLPTTFDEHGQLDLESQVRVVDFFLEAGVHGFCILANFSEQFALSDAERDRLTETILRHTRDRVPVIVTTSHYSARVAAERSQRAQALGAAMVMLMPPFHGTIRPDEAGIFEFFSSGPSPTPSISRSWSRTARSAGSPSRPPSWPAWPPRSVR